MKAKQSQIHPYLSANYLSRLTYWWLLEIFRLGKNNNLYAENIYKVLPENVSETLGDQMEKLWENEVMEAKMKSRKPKLWKVIWNNFVWTIIQQWFGALVTNLCRIVQTLIMAKLISYFNPLSTMTHKEAYINATGFMLTTILICVMNRRILYGQYIIGMRVKIACSSLIYRKVLKLSCKSAGPSVNGLVINILSNDFARFDKYFTYLPYMWLTPLMIVLVAYLIWLELGVSIFAGILCMMLQMIPTQLMWYRIIPKLRGRSAAETDSRVLMIGEIINGIRVIKMYAWENYFEQLVCRVRKQEIEAMFMTFYITSINFAMGIFTDRTSLFCTVAVYVWVGNEVTADKIFSTTGYFVFLRVMAFKFFPGAVFSGSALKVTLNRVEVNTSLSEEFLLCEEITEMATITKPIDNSAILIKNVVASWASNSNINRIDDIDVRITCHKLYAVVGPIGSGKSSLIKLILGELQPRTGQISVYGKVSYASQEPWLFTGSVRDNILFGEQYDEDRYNKVVDVCQLLRDFEQLPYADRTLVREREACLSVEVNVRGAVYRDADIYLFDDPLSAVDSHLSNHLFEHCINGFLKDKTRILVTHQVQYLKDADEIITLIKGQIAFQGDYQTFVATEENLDYLSRNEEEEEVIEDKNVDESEITVTAVKEEDGESQPEESKESIAQGRIKIALLFKYFKAGGSFLTIMFIMLLSVITQLLVSGFDYWLAFWTNQEEKREWVLPTSISTNTTVLTGQYLDDETALYVTGGLAIAIIVLSILKNVLFFRRSLNSSKNIHNSMFCRLLKAPLQFYPVNPSGRMLNRFSKDTGTVDEEMPIAMLDVIERLLILVSVIIQIVIINWWMSVPIVIAGYFVIKITNIYFSTTKALKRLEGNAKSPVFSLVSSTLLGLSTIRSCCAQKIVRRDFDERQDANSAAQYLCLVITTAYRTWVDLLACIVLGIMVYICIPLKGSNLMGGDVGLALTQFLTICTNIQYVLRQFADFIFHMTAVERMFEYMELEQEGPYETEPDKLPNQSWPNQAELKFENLSLRYSDKDQPVLKNLDFTIRPNMKIGIVGRTGAGKSSLVTALFRFAEFEGAIFIDEVNTKQVGLLDLRSRISVIPQEPTIFTTSLRDNLDPLHQYDDACLRSVLKEVEMSDVFESLEQPVNGNLSAGQRQLLCLARAIIGKNKILVLDEATANIDPATDELIQKTIRTRFNDCTVLAIAHRLNTIVDNDAILVMENGRIVEFDQPYVLLQKERGYLKDMVNKSGSASSLIRIAEKAYDESLRSGSHRI